MLGFWYRLKRQIATGAGVLADSVSASRMIRVMEVRLHLDAAASATEDFTITLNSVSGTKYDVNLVTQDMAGVGDLIWRPDAPVILAKGDTLDIAFANSDTNEFGLETVYQEI